MSQQFQSNKSNVQATPSKFGGSGQGNAAKKDQKWTSGSGNASKSENVELNTASPGGSNQNKDGGETKKPFTGRSRLFIGNLSEDTTEEHLRKTLDKYGNITELYVNGKRGFAFVKFDTKASADAAKEALDCKKLNNRIIRVRFAAHGAALRVKNLSPYATNELLEQAFSTFGPIERCIHIVDDRGRPIGEGIIEFSKKMSSQVAIKKCTEGCFLLGSYPKPVIVEQLEQNDEDDGLQEKNVTKNNRFNRDREKGPRFVPRASFEHDFALRWKELFEIEKQKREALEREINDSRAKLEEQMEFALYEQETNVLREQLRMREEEANQILRERDMRRDEMIRRSELHRPDDMYHSPSDSARSRPPMDDMRRRSDNAMMMQQEMNFPQRNGNKMGGMNMRGNDRNSIGNNMGGPMDSGMRQIQGGSGHMSNMQGPLVGAPVPPAELLNAAIPQSRQSRFDQSGFGKDSAKGDSGNLPGPRGQMDRNDSRGPPMGGAMQGMGSMGTPPFKRGGMSEPWEQDKRRRF